MMVSARMSEATTAVESVSDSDRKNCPTTPDSRPRGAKTTTVVSVELTIGAVRAARASATRRAGSGPGAAMHALDDHDGVVDHESDGDGEPAHRHEVDRLVEDAHHGEGREHRKRQRHGRDDREPPVAKEDEEHDHGEEAADQDRVAHARDRRTDEFGQVVDLRDLQAGGQRQRKLADRLFHARFDLQHVRADLLRDADARGIVSVALDQAGPIRRPREDLGHVAEADDRVGPCQHRRLGDLIQRPPQAGGQRQLLRRRRRDGARRARADSRSADDRRRRAP